MKRIMKLKLLVLYVQHVEGEDVMENLIVYKCKKCIKVFKCEYKGIVVECVDCPVLQKGVKCYEASALKVNDEQFCNKCKEVK